MNRWWARCFLDGEAGTQGQIATFDVGPFQSMGELSASIAVNFQNTFKSKVLWIEKLWKAIC